jgi:hypothetical protein
MDENVTVRGLQLRGLGGGGGARVAEDSRVELRTFCWPLRELLSNT